MQQLTNESQLLRGFNIPTSTSTSQTGPAQQGQMGISPLQQLMSLGTLGTAMFQSGKDGTTPAANLMDFIKTQFGSGATPTPTPEPITYNSQNQAVDQFGNLLATNAQNAYGDTGTLAEQNASQLGDPFSTIANTGS